jgi:hypothetical protein
MHAHAWHVRYVDDEAHLTREASARDGEPDDRGNRRGSALTHPGRRAVAVCGNSGELWATCEGSV